MRHLSLTILTVLCSLTFGSCSTTVIAAPQPATAPAAQAPSAAGVANASNTPCSDFLGGVVCTASGSFSLRQTSAISDYYGYVTATTNTNFSVLKNTDNWFVAKLKDLIGDKKDYTARIDLDLRLKDATGVEKPLGTYSLLAFKVVGGHVAAEQSGSISILTDAPITNSFSLRDYRSVIVIFRVTTTEDTSINLTAFLNTITPITSAVGGGLATSISGTGVKAATGLLDSQLTSKQLRNVEFRSILDATKDGTKTIVFTAPMAPGTNDSDFKLTLRLVPRASLILPDAPSDQALMWDISVSNPEARIKLADGSPLSTFLASRGIPVRDFTVIPSATEGAAAAQARVQHACIDLRNALTTSDYIPLNQFDSEVIIHDRLSNDSSGLDANTMGAPCIKERMGPNGTWARYGIPSIALLSIPPVEKPAADFFFRRLNRAMVVAAPAARKEALAPFIDPLNFNLFAPTSMIPGAENQWRVIDPDTGIGRDLGPTLFSQLRSCALGAWVRAPSADPPNVWTFLLLPENSKIIYQGTAVFGRDPSDALVLKSLTFVAKPADVKFDGSEFADDPDVKAVVAGGQGGACT